MRIRVYRNLHTGTLSMQAYNKEKKGWRVIGHPSHVTLENVEFVVRQAGRLRVLKEKRKNVHAWVEGDFVNCTAVSPRPYREAARYNPYKYETWVDSVGRDICGRKWPEATVSSDGKVTFEPVGW